jgi:hypothetical protein
MPFSIPVSESLSLLAKAPRDTGIDRDGTDDACFTKFSRSNFRPNVTVAAGNIRKQEIDV